MPKPGHVKNQLNRRVIREDLWMWIRQRAYENTFFTVSSQHVLWIPHKRLWPLQTVGTVWRGRNVVRLKVVGKGKRWEGKLKLAIPIWSQNPTKVISSHATILRTNMKIRIKKCVKRQIYVTFYPIDCGGMVWRWWLISQLVKSPHLIILNVN